MKITVQLVAGAALAVLLLVLCLYTYFGGTRDRRVGKAYNQARQALIMEDTKSATEHLEELVSLRPDLAGVNLSLGSLYLGLNRPDDARKIFEGLAANRKAGGELRALAHMHLGMLDGQAAAKAAEKITAPAERAPLFASARKHFEDALKLEEEARKKDAGQRGKLEAAGDAVAGLGLIALWCGDYAEAEKQFTAALKGDRLLGKEVIPEVFNGLGLLAGTKGNLADSGTYFARAARARRDWKIPAANRKYIEEAMVGSDKMDPNIRKRLLTELDAKLPAIKEGKAAVLNALGCGYYQLGDFATAAARLEEAVKLRPDDAGFLTNLLAAHAQILGSRRAAVEAARAKAFPPQEGDPARRFWLTMPDKQLPPPTPATSRELKALQDATAALADVEGPFDRAAGEFLGRTQPAPELQAALLLVRIEMRLRAAEALTAAGGKPEKEKAAALSAEAAKLLAAARGKFSDDARLARMEGLRLLADGKIPEALEVLKRSLAKDGQQEDLRALVAAFARPLEAVALRPVALPGKTGPVLALSPRPILGALFRAGNSLVPPAAGKMQIFVDGRQQDGGLLGTEFLCLSDALPEGVHAVSVEGQDGLGRKASAETKILVDTAPPDIVAMDPTDGGTVTGPRPKLAFECRDRQSGLDITSIEVELRSLKGATTLLTDSPVRGGRYTFDFPQASIKKGALLPADGKVVFYPPHNLGAGPYLLTVSVGDVRGNKQTRTWKFTVAE